MASDVLYEAMKLAAKKRKIKVSPQHDLYKRVDPYFSMSFIVHKMRMTLKPKMLIFVWILV